MVKWPIQQSLCKIVARFILVLLLEFILYALINKINIKQACEDKALVRKDCRV